MTIYFENLAIFIFCAFVYPWGETINVSLLYALFSLTLSCFLMILKQKPLLYILGITALGTGILHPDFICFFPALFYPLCYRRKYALPLCGLFLAIFYQYHSASKQLLLILFAISLYLALRSQEREQLKTSILQLRDNSVEQELHLRQKQRQLLARQNDEIYIATLRERNRIAREIHDNVGHMLSRSILQVGALLAIYREDSALSPHLIELKSSLDEAMNNIRNSVHNLHDESIDLKNSLKNLADSFPFCPVQLDCDVSRQLPKEIKYCFIAIVKEALNNIIKHSNATKVSIMAKEHPGLYQLLIEDNGTKVFSVSDTSGMGLSNMRDRVDALHGIIHISSEQGVKIFISIPKTIMKNGVTDENCID